MDFKKMLNNAGTKFGRVVQKTEETFLSTDKTEYDSEYKEMLKKLELLKYWTDRFIKETSVVLEPNIANRLEDKVLDKFDKKTERPTQLELFGVCYEKAAEALAPYSADLGKCLISFGHVEVRVGATEREFQKSAMEVYVSHLKDMTDRDLKKYQDEHNELENLRLDLDSSRSRKKRSLSDTSKKNAEDTCDKAQAIFEEKLQRNKVLFQDIDTLFTKHKELIKTFIGAQIKYYSECQKELERLDKQL